MTPGPGRRQRIRPRRGASVARATAALLAFLFLSWLLAPLPALAVTPFTIEDIRVEGLQHVETATVLATVPLRTGQVYTDKAGSAALRALFELGLFKDVRIDTRGPVLVLVVEERPTIAQVEFLGAREFDKEALAKALRDVGLAEDRPYDRALADRAEQELKRQYIGRSFYSAQVQTTTTPQPHNRVRLSFSVTEGDPARIEAVRVTGNQAFDSATLLSLFDLDAGNWMSWYTKSDQYTPAKLEADLAGLRRHYLTRGYAQFRIESTQVGLSADRQRMTITVNIREGEALAVAGVRLEGDFLGREDAFRALVSIRPGALYNVDTVDATLQAFRDHFARFGHAFARVQAEPEVDAARQRLTLVLKAQPLRRIFVRRIEIGGNQRTRDEVVRRELRQFEGAWYDGDRIRLSRDRLLRLGFFTEVDIRNEPVPGREDQVDLHIDLKEKATGSLQMGAGFSSTDKISLSFGITQENLFGSGHYLGLNVNTSSYAKTISVTAVDPYFTADGISRSISLAHSVSRPSYEADGNYKLSTDSASMRFGVPFNEVDRVFFGIGLERYSFSPGTNSTYTLVDGSYVYTATPQAYLDYFGCTGTVPSVSCSQAGRVGVPLTVGWSRDDRDSAITPTRGTLQGANLELGAASNMRYAKASWQHQHYVPLSRQYTLSFNSELGYAKALSGSSYPIFKNFYAGGLGSVRGFESNSLGPRDSVTGAALGGTRKAVFNAELSTPFPGAGNDRSLRMFGFVDVGNVFSERTADMTQAQWKARNRLRASTGLGVSWLSPLGPLSLAYALPLRYQKLDEANGIAADRLQRIQFQIGSSF